MRKKKKGDEEEDEQKESISYYPLRLWGDGEERHMYDLYVEERRQQPQK